MKLAAVSLLSLILVVLLFQFLSEADGAAEAVQRQVQVEANEPAAAPRELARAEDERAAVRHEDAALEAGAQLEVEEVATPRPQVRRLQGRVVVSDERGVEHEEVDGEIDILSWTGNSGLTHSTTVEAGRFELEVPECESYSISELTAEGRGAVLEEPGRHYTHAEAPLLVRAHWPKSMRLSVLDQATGVHLGEVTVTSGERWPADGAQHPGRVRPSAIVIEHGQSPLELRPTSRDVRSQDQIYHVHSPGHAWQAIHLDMSHGGERQLRLPLGGDLELHLVGELAKGKPMLRLRALAQPDSEPFAEIRARSSEPIELLGLVPGTYRATLELGDWFESFQPLAEREVEIVAGQRAQYELQLLELVPEREARLAGTVVVPQEWGLESFRVTAEPDGNRTSRSHEQRKEQMQALGNDGDSWAFDLGELPVGAYNLELASGSFPAEVEYSILVELLPGGTTNVRLELPVPATIVLHLLEAESGDPADVASVHWGPIHPSKGRVGSLITESREQGEDYFEFRVPVGEVSLGSFGSGYDSINEKLDVKPGRNEYSFRLERECPLLIVFLDGETPVPLAQHWWPEPEHLDGDGKLLYTRGGSSGFSTALSQPGRYRFEMPVLPGFEAIPEQEISVERGEDTRHEVKLVRKQ